MGFPQWVSRFKEPHTEIKFINGRYYKYQISHQYDPARKRTVKKTGRLLGKITEDDGFIPSAKNALRMEAEAPPKVDIKTFGVYALFEDLLKDEIPSLQKVFGKENTERLLAFAMFRWAYNSPIKRVLNYHAHDFCSEHWSKDIQLNDKQITALLKYIGENRELVVKWTKELLPSASAASENFIMMDSTHAMSASDNLEVNVKGYNPAHDFGRQVRLMYLFSAEMKRPVYYKLVNGNITDISSMSLCIKEVDIKNIIFIADKGFYSTENIKLLDEQGLHYIIPLRRNNPVIDYNLISSGGLKKTKQFFMYQKRAVWYYQYTVDNKQYITFLDERLRVEEEEDYLQRITTQPEEFTQENYIEKLYHFGTMTLVYKTDVPHTSEQLYSAYKQRNEIEIMFDSYKTFLKADVTYMQNRHVLEGWLFTNFIAMIAYYKLFDRLRIAELLKKESPKDIIELAKAVCQFKIRGVWHRGEIPKRIQKLFGKIGIDSLN